MQLKFVVACHPVLNEAARWYAEPVLTMLRDTLPTDELQAALRVARHWIWSRSWRICWKTKDSLAPGRPGESAQSEAEQAVELYALASRYPFVANSRCFEDVAGRHVAAVAATLPPGVVTAAQEPGRARDLDATVAELLTELEA